ncbi:site-specific integrase [Brevibacillus borstelensis]|nr:site-specific integrase [Brevibacillus borstelensis]
MFKKLKKVFDFKDVRLSCHTFRHTFAHRMCMNGCDVFSLQRMLRHTEIEMTSRYISMWGTALKEQNDKYNPLNHLEV